MNQSTEIPDGQLCEGKRWRNGSYQPCTAAAKYAVWTSDGPRYVCGTHKRGYGYGKWQQRTLPDTGYPAALYVKRIREHEDAIQGFVRNLEEIPKRITVHRAEVERLTGILKAVEEAS